MLDIIFAAATAFIAGSIFSDKSNSKARFQSTDSKPQTHIVTPDKSIFNEIRDINAQISEINRRHELDHKLSENYIFQKSFLDKKREEVFSEYSRNKNTQIIQDVKLNPDSYNQFNITDQKIHMLQWHVGETVLNKHCPICNKPMVLQFARDCQVSATNDFFWACTGWYQAECQMTIPLTDPEISLLSKNNVNEYQISNSQFSNIFSDINVQSHTRKRIGRHTKDVVNDYVCPIHKEPLVLREKNDSNGILDAFFLGCPLFSKQNCRYVLKLKSPAQLAAFLDKTENRGII
jgi:hypothetical protein